MVLGRDEPNIRLKGVLFTIYTIYSLSAEAKHCTDIFIIIRIPIGHCLHSSSSVCVSHTQRIPLPASTRGCLWSPHTGNGVAERQLLTKVTQQQKAHRLSEPTPCGYSCVFRSRELILQPYYLRWHCCHSPTVFQDMPKPHPFPP